MDKFFFHEPNIIDYLGEKKFNPIGVRKLIYIYIYKFYVKFNATKLIRFLITSKEN